ncbi:MAG: carboxymethylenebutenolidase, partial [Firmicutes bacterium HGW-Firmicutes-18]
ITCILVKMPFNMAIFNSNAAERIIDQFPEIKNWYIAGHSMGGAMASNYASKNQDKIKGLILMGAYIYGDYPDEKALTIYGTFNTSVAEKIDYTKNIVVIEGGNHAQFGNYGKQKGDPDATISREEQQDIAVEAIKEFLAKE